jgi:hypothetical protein
LMSKMLTEADQERKDRTLHEDEDVNCWTCRLCGKSDEKVAKKLHKETDDLPFNWLRRYDTKITRDVNLASALRSHASEQHHMPTWNAAYTQFYGKETKFEASDTPVERMACFTLFIASSDATYEDFISRNPLPFSKLNLTSYLSMRIGEALGALNRGVFVNTTMKKTIALEEKGALVVDPFADITADELKEEVKALIKGVHLESMKRAIYADTNWQVILTMGQKDLYQVIQDVFVGSHFGPSNIYMPSMEEMPVCQPAGSPLNVSGNVKLNRKRGKPS